MHIIRHPAFRWSISIVLIVMMGYQLWTRSHHFADLQWDTIGKAGYGLIWVVLLMPVNWILETLKWQKLLRKHFPIGFSKAFKAVTRGIALALFTPNRIGEYGGRLIQMPVHYRWPILSSTLVSSVSQNLVAFCAGIISCIFLFSGNITLKIFGVGLSVLSVIAFFNLPLIVRFVSRIHIHPFINKGLRKLNWIDVYNKKDLGIASGFSLLRYIIYSTQFVMLILAFEPKASIFSLYLGVSALYLFHTLLPMPPIADVLARTNLALILWSGTGMSELSISLASLLVWAINLLLPALFGSIVIGTYRPVKTFITHDAHLSPALEPVMANPTERS